MDVTILIAPAGNGFKPVKFMPRSHIISVPDDDDDVAADMVERFTNGLVSQYHSEVYTWESVKATPDLMEKFRLYVEHCESLRLEDIRRQGIIDSYNIAGKIGVDSLRTPALFDSFVGRVRLAVPNVTRDAARWILSTARDGDGITDFVSYCAIVNRCMIAGR